MDSPEDEKRLWMEITKSTNEHGGDGWEYGTCLWSPCTAKHGGDRYRVMHLPRKGEKVIHCYDAVYRGVSRVVEECKVASNRPPKPEPWNAHGLFYRIELADYREFPRNVNRADFVAEHSEEILAEIENDHPPRYPFIYHTKRITTVQGQFLTIVTPTLRRLLAQALGIAEDFILSSDD